MTRQPPKYPYGFAFCVTREGQRGWVSAEAHTLRDVLTAAPELRVEELDQVWCLHSFNMIWGFLQENGGPPEPWEEDDKPEGSGVLMHSFVADPKLTASV